MTAHAPGRTARQYLMCEPSHYTVSYEINPWMDRTRHTDVDLAVRQWRTLRDTFLDLGHTVETIDPLPGLPDMVYAANGATVVDGVVYSAKFRYPERQPEGPAYQKWFADRGWVTHTAEQTNEGEGDLLVVGDLILAGTGFRTSRAAHAELQELVGRPVISLELVDPHYYHLDTALTVLSSDAAAPQVAYYPPAFSPGSRAVLAQLFPEAVVATADDAAALGLNAVSDGENVVVAPAATHFAGALRERGYTPVPVDTSELLKGGGGAKCCTLELRR
ncbi:dimethylargininase [Cellulomonas shaoxiangyii]|uniref:N-dimethylarginine dimethylaminohydrolase n=1 Tax=Cellulomonas shaoxiangyii TaxID=2566013 RepID=A0A4P7SP97_9CELL|nr:dimethylargininase [Cellulomonas shaoxiangyii]QCB94523.1 N-dimethylarginine dimethylaminohydrolase [Cellulomonas shaoxiangyii]TGY86104.1 N-dimethylarginine dimethylaminohydrolase [Cellulomonas shaoxiangyii]